VRCATQKRVNKKKKRSNRNDIQNPRIVPPTHAHELISDVANNLIHPRFDGEPLRPHPKVTHDLPSRANFQPALPIPLEQHRENIEIRVSTRAPEIGAEDLVLGGMVVQESEGGLGVGESGRGDGAGREGV
jgi:hypothetical protein